MTSAAVLSLIFGSCIITASSRIILKKGLQISNALTGMVCSLVFGWIMLLILFMANFNEQSLSLKGVLLFAGIGTIAPPVVRYFTYLGVEKVGPSRTDPIRSLTPLFAILFSFIFFNEVFNFYSLLAGGLIVLGAYFLSQDGINREKEKRIFNLKDLLYPFVAAIIAGLISNLRKLGMDFHITSIAAALVAASSAIIVFSVFLLYKNNYQKISLDKNSIKYLIISGALVSITDVIDLIALKHAPVSMVAPLLATTPIFVILFSWVFLRNIEQITHNLITGAILISGGVSLIAFLASKQ